MFRLSSRFHLALGSTVVWTPWLSWAFSFSYSAPKSCDPFKVEWNGGTTPFSLLLTTPSGTPRNVSIPDDAWNGSSGSFATTLNYTAGQSFVLTMSDATGFGTGGNSDLLIVGGGSTTCNTTNPSPGFSFQAPSNAQQCGQYLISGYDAATQPVLIQGLVPLGSSFVISPPNGSTSYNWTVNVASGTRLLFFMKDAQGRFGITSSLLQIAPSSNSSCIDGNSPHSTISSETGSPSSTGGSSPSQLPADGGGQSHGSNAAIIGGAVGGGVAFLLAIILLVFCLKRRRADPMKRYSRKRANNGLDGMRTLDLAPSTPSLHPSPSRLPPLQFEPVPFVLPRASSGGGGDNAPMAPTEHSGHSQALSSSDHNAPPHLGHNPQSPSQGTATDLTGSSAARKAAMAGPSAQGLAPPPRFVLHTDAGSVDNMNASTVELPPTYNAANQVSGGSAPTASGGSPSPSGADAGAMHHP